MQAQFQQTTLHWPMAARNQNSRAETGTPASLQDTSMCPGQNKKRTMTSCQAESRLQPMSQRKAPHLCIKMNMEERRRALLVGRLHPPRNSSNIIQRFWDVGGGLVSVQTVGTLVGAAGKVSSGEISYVLEQSSCLSQGPTCQAC